MNSIIPSVNFALLSVRTHGSVYRSGKYWLTWIEDESRRPWCPVFALAEAAAAPDMACAGLCVLVGEVVAAAAAVVPG